MNNVCLKMSLKVDNGKAIQSLGSSDSYYSAGFIVLLFYL